MKCQNRSVGAKLLSLTVTTLLALFSGAAIADSAVSYPAVATGSSTDILGANWLPCYTSVMTGTVSSIEDQFQSCIQASVQHAGAVGGQTWSASAISWSTVDNVNYTGSYYDTIVPPSQFQSHSANAYLNFFCNNGGVLGASLHDSFGDSMPDTCLIIFNPGAGGPSDPTGCPAGNLQDSGTGQCYVRPDKGAGNDPSNPSAPGTPGNPGDAGEPINPATGNMNKAETDYRGGGVFPLVLTRSYNSLIANQGTSLGGADQSFGAGWTSNLAAHLVLSVSPLSYASISSGVCTDPATGVTYVCMSPTLPANSYYGVVVVWHGDGSQSVFSGTFTNGGGPSSVLAPAKGAVGQLSYSSGSYIYQRLDGYTEIYNSSGQLTSVSDPHGAQQIYAYTSGQLATVTDANGRSMSFTYTSGLVHQVTVPSRSAVTGTSVIDYEYDTAGNLASVTYDYGMADATTINYEYGDTSSGMSHALTGVKDEDGDEYIAWSYDDTSGNAACSEFEPSANAASTGTTCSGDTGNADGERTLITYNTDGSADVTEATGEVRHMTFTDVNGRNMLASVDKRCHGCGNRDHLITYDSNGHVATITDFNGNVTNYSIDAAGFEQSRTEAVGDATYQRTIVTTWYTPTGGVEAGLPKSITEEDASGTPLRVTTWCYNVSTSCNDATSIGTQWSKTVTDPINTALAARTTKYTYSGGFLASADGPLTGLTDTTTLTRYTSNGTGHNAHDVSTVTDALGHATSVTQYSAAGFPMSVTDPNSVVTTYGYDARGRLLAKTLDASGTPDTTTYTYYADGMVHTKALPITASGHAYETYSYDRAHRLIGVLNDVGESRTIAYTYNTGSGTFDVEEQRFASGGGSAVFDQHVTRDDSVDQVRYANGVSKVTTLQYDANGNVISITDPLSHVTTRYFDPLNRLQQSQDPKNGYTSYSVDALGHVIDITSPRGLNTSYTEDAFGEKLSQVSPDTGTTSYDYSQWVSAAKIVKTDARNKVQTYSYDALYRLLSQSNGQRSYTYTYDNATSGYHGIGRLDTATILGNSEAYRYDSHGMVSRKTTTVGASGQDFIQAYHHDAADNLTSVAYPPANGTVVYDLDNIGRVQEVHATCCSTTDELLASNITYMPFGPVSGLTYGNGLMETRDFDAAYRLIGVHTKDGSTPVVQDWTYAYNDDGTISGITDNLTSANSQTFGYDPMQRLVTATGAYGSITIGSDPVNHPELSYDADGNRTQIDQAGTVTSYTYDTASNRLLSSLTGTQTTTYGYDADGSITSDGTYTYTYDINERIGEVLQGSIVEYKAQNNYLGQRISKTVGTTAYGFVYDEQGHLIAELNPDGTILKEHIWFGDRPLAYYQTNINGSSSSDVKYLHVDQVNAPRLMTTSTKAVGWTWNSDPWGTTTVSSGSYHIRYPGQYYDAQTGNMQNWMRDYDPQTGRYLQSDPMGLGGGINTYTYALNNPLSYIDPFGQYICIYNVAIHSMICIPDVAGDPIFNTNNNFTSGNNLAGLGCRDNPICEGISNQGPIPAGTYTVGARIAPGRGIRPLFPHTPNPNGRNSFEFHGCTDPNSCSQGCLAATSPDVRDQLNNYFDMEPNSTLIVLPGDTEQVPPGP